jgi:hypothetical protein
MAKAEFHVSWPERGNKPVGLGNRHETEAEKVQFSSPPHVCAGDKFIEKHGFRLTAIPADWNNER